MKSVKRFVSHRSGVSTIESLEGRVLFQTSPSVSSILADNQGEATITMSEALKPSTVNVNSVQLYVAGSGSSDPTAASHVLQPATVTYDKSTDQIVIQTTTRLAASTPYEVILKGTITGSGANDTSHLIGGGPGVTGTAGMRYGFVTSIDSTKIALFQTSLGDMNVQLQPKSSMPATISNFIQYVNSGAYDGTFFHRLGSLSSSNANEQLDIIQAGGFDISGDTVETIPTRSAINLESGISNTIGTIAMARTSSPDSATDQFFFNYADNSSSLNEPAGSSPTSGYAAFGTITSAAGLQTLAALSGLPTLDMMTAVTTGNNANFYSGTGIDVLPVLHAGVSPAAVDSDLADNLVFITRVAMQSSTGAVTFPGTTPSAAAPSAIVAGNNTAPSVFASSTPIGGGDASNLLALLNSGAGSVL